MNRQEKRKAAKQAKKLQGKTIITTIFDDSVYGHEIKNEWGMHMTDAMWYCQCRAAGHSMEEVEQAWNKYIEEMSSEECPW